VTGATPDNAWRQAAACRGRDSELFFPIGKTGPAVAQIQRAKAICAGCASRPDCLAFALDTRQPYGIWGGLDEDERRALRSQRRRQSTRRPAPILHSAAGVTARER
jgi:WhiB family redox-sensing transcriptional regulator